MESKKTSTLTKKLMSKERSGSKRWFSCFSPDEPPKEPMELNMELAKTIEESETTRVIHIDWKLSDYQLWLLLPCQTSNPSHLPWAFFKPASNPNRQIFGDIETKRSYCMESSLFNREFDSNLELLHSKEGWLLVTAPYLDRKNNGSLNSRDGKAKIPWTYLGLVNPSNGTRWDLPVLRVNGKCKKYGAFTTESNNKRNGSKPDQVVYVSALAAKLRIYITRASDPRWSKYVFKCSILPSSIILCGTKLYGFFASKVLEFDITSSNWCQYDLLNQMNVSTISYYKHLECEGKLVIAGCPSAFLNSHARTSIPFYKLEPCGDGKNMKWVELSDAELDGRVWFFSRAQSFCVKLAGSARKVCWFESKPLLNEKERVCDRAFGVHCGDLKSGIEMRLTKDYFLCHEPSSALLLPEPSWIDMSLFCENESNLGITDRDLLPFPDNWERH